MQKKDAQELLKKFEDGECSAEELALLETWYNQHTVISPKKLTDAEWTEDVSSLLKSLESIGNQQAKIVQWPRIVAAASLLVFLSVGGYFVLQQQHKRQQTVQNQLYDVAPGGNKAILTLGNGKQIILTDAKKGELAHEDHMAIKKTADGEVEYQGTSSNREAIVFNTMSTPRGGEFTLVLSDGTKVILNAASSIKYPTAFTGKDRRVEITGEAYFEVAHNAARPFKVTCTGQTITVLGTHFNVNAYADEPAVKTTLLEGSVSVAAVADNTIIKPGQQAILTQNKFRVLAIDTDEVIAWKQGMFRFNGTPLATIMKQVARWYNVDVVYEDETLKTKSFFAMSTRFAKVSQLLNDLEETGDVKFRIEGKKITVFNK